MIGKAPAVQDSPVSLIDVALAKAVALEGPGAVEALVRGDHDIYPAVRQPTGEVCCLCSP